MFWLKRLLILGPPVLVATLCPAIGQEQETVILEQGCTFKANPDDVLNSQARVRTDVYERVRKFSAGRRSVAEPQAAASIPRRNFIDDEIFGKLDKMGVPSAALTTDEEFVRRIYLDLTGRIPTPQEIRDFVADPYKEKRFELADRLMATQEFSDKWAVWLEDVLQATEQLSTGNRRPQIEGRNTFDAYLREAMQNNKPIKDIAVETITAKGNNYFTENGPVNYMVAASTAMGPAEDTYDMALVRSATAYLGLGHYDCLLCHNGRGHLDQISLWASQTARVEAWKMSAHFSRTRWNGVPGTQQYMSPLFNSTDVQDLATGNYSLNTNFGNRPERCANNVKLVNGKCPTTGTMNAEYRDGSAVPVSGNWRDAFAKKLVADPMFGRNFANRIWKAFFTLALVDPVDTLDPARLDPKNPPPAPWAFQATHPELLEKLAQNFTENNTDLRRFIRTIVNSSAYQLSSDYSAPWKYEYTTLFARHYPRRLMAEEIHDAITKATGVYNSYTWPIVNGQTIAQGSALPQSTPVQWAMKLPDINEPRNNGVLTFLNSFSRGNRDTTPRAQTGSILQELNIMNDAFVTSRAKAATSPVLKELLKIQNNSDMLDEMFLTFLSRKPSDAERQKAVAFLGKYPSATQRAGAVEDIAWALMNKLDFLFSY